ncbi:MAG: hypothetical protein IKJ39_04285 [Lachnospiraceae bacterium]|nr:hypothetical protein [Lachnospiraceae bacterium]
MWEWMRGMDEYYIKCLVGVTLISTIILLIRCFFGKKLSKRFVYGMWLAIPVFLVLVPWVKIPMPQFVADFGRETYEKLEGEVYTIILPAEAELEKDTLADALQNGEPVSGDMMSSIIESSEGGMIETKMPGDNVATIIAKVIVAIYVLIVLAIVAGIVSTNVRFEYRCRHNRVYLGETPRSKLPVYKLENITSPFLLCATMYVPEGMTEDELRYAMLHEEGHFKHGDFFWVITRYVLLAVFFYNPVVWLAFKYSGYDCELACDESVMRRIKVTERKAYGGSLLDVLKKRRGLGQRVLLSTNMKAPKKLIRARIENIVAGRKGSVLVASLAAIAVLLVTGCGFMEQKAAGNNVVVSADTESAEKVSVEVREEEALESLRNQQPEGEGAKLQARDEVVDYGDTVYFCAEVLKRNDEHSYENITDKHEIYAKIGKEIISVGPSEAPTIDLITYVAKEAVGKKRGDIIQLIRELNGAEYHYFYRITSINDTIGSDYLMPNGWDYQFPKPVVGRFFDDRNKEADFGFDGQSWENEVSIMEYYTVATASSYLEPSGVNAYHPNNVVSNNKMSTWAEGAEGVGIGESIELRQMYMGPGADRLSITRFCIVNGYAKNNDIWEKNARVKELKVYYSEAYMGTITLEDCMEPQYIDVSGVNMTVSNGREAVFRFEIADVYPGTKYEDTCLTGIQIEFKK